MRNSSTSPGFWIRPLTIIGMAIRRAFFDALSMHSGSVSTAYGTALVTTRPLRELASRSHSSPGLVSSAICVSVRFQPLTDADVAAPCLPPSGKICVTNGCSPMAMR